MQKKKDGKRPKRSELKSMIQDVFYNNPKKTYNYKQLAALLNVEKKSGRQMVEVLLFELVESGLLSEGGAGRLKLLSRGMQRVGKVDMTASGASYIVREDGGEAVLVAQPNMNTALHGDVLKILQLARQRRRQMEREVIQLLTRKRELFAGTLEVTQNFPFLLADSRVINKDIFIPKDKLKTAVNGQKAVAKIVEWPAKAKNPVGEIVDILGDAGQNNTEMHAILAEFNLPYTYPDEVVAAAAKIPDEIRGEDIARRRG